MKRYEFGKMTLTQLPGIDPAPTLRFHFEFFLSLSEAPPYEVRIPVPVDYASILSEPTPLRIRTFRRTKVRDDTDGRYVYVEA